MFKKIILILILVTSLILLVGCSEDISQNDPMEFLDGYVESLRGVESYKATMNVNQNYGDSVIMDWDITIYESLGENSLYYLTSLDGQKVMEIYQLDDNFTISFDFGGFTHSETFTGDDFTQTTEDILIMEAFEDLTAFTNLILTEDRNHYILVGESLTPTLLDNELISFDEFQYQLDDSRIEIQINKRTEHIEKVVLETVLLVEGETITTKAELFISDINNTNNIKELINN